MDVEQLLFISSQNYQLIGEKSNNIIDNEYSIDYEINNFNNNFSAIFERPQYIKKENNMFGKPEKENEEYINKYTNKPIFMKHEKTNIKNRKYMKDDMRKRIKSNFYKQLKKKLNDKLREINIFNQNFAFSQSMIINVAKIENKKNLDMSLKEILLKEYKNDFKSKKNKDIINKYIKKDDPIDNILKIQLKFLYNEYLHSEQFNESINKLSEEENYDYIHNYIKVAEKFIYFFTKEKIELNEDFQIFNKTQKDYKSIIYYQKPLFTIFIKKIGKRDSEEQFLNRKKIRTKFYNLVIDKLNELTNSEKYSFQQKMTNDEENKEIANLTLKDVLNKKNFFKDNNDEELNDSNNNELSTILKMKIKDIYDDYLKSNQYYLSINELEEEDEYYYDDIYKYNKEAKTLFDF